MSYLIHIMARVHKIIKSMMIYIKKPSIIELILKLRTRILCMIGKELGIALQENIVVF